MKIDLNHMYPEGADGTRRPLPKQALFLKQALTPTDKGGPKFVAYVGGVGSGKTLNGCITMITLAVLYPGDYLICRQFMPELKITTLKTFLEVCPPELIEEYRVADAIVRIKCANGKISNVYFRQLEEPDKFRSMNLSGFLIDEGNQVSEDSFMLLQGRLRGPGLRKGFITTNPAGHDWVYRWFFKKDHIKDPKIKDQFYLIKAPSTENVHLPDGYIETLKATWSEDRIKREIEGSFDAFEGMVYNEFRRDVHVIKPFKIPDAWPKHIRIDHGYRNPTAALFFAIGPDGEVYLYRELYVQEWLINEIIGDKKYTGGNFDPGLIRLARGESFQSAKIDPSTKNRKGTAGESDYDEYRRHWPEGWPVLGLAKNDVQLGIERVKSYLKQDPVTGKPLLYIFENCDNTLEEITQYKYPELKPNQEGKKAEHEKPMKVNDHAMDALRYMIIDLPERHQEKDDPLKRLKYNTLERSLYLDLQKFKKPKVKDPFGDGF